MLFKKYINNYLPKKCCALNKKLKRMKANVVDDGSNRAAV